MRAALCAPFMEADLLEDRLHGCIPEEFVIDEYNHMGDLLDLPSVCIYDYVIVAGGGPGGMEGIIALRQRHADIPVLWITDDMRYASAGYSWRVAQVLPFDCSEEQLAAALHLVSLKNGRIPIKEVLS